jgi:hypothetical protein
MSVFVIRDNEKMWPKAYSSFGEAMSLVIKHINSVNKAYSNSQQYEVEPILPGQMEEYDISKVKEGILVANVYDYDQQIFIQELVL